MNKVKGKTVADLENQIYLITCNFEWEHQSEESGEGVENWMRDHAAGRQDSDFPGEDTKGHNLFQVWKFATCTEVKIITTTTEEVVYLDEP